MKFNMPKDQSSIIKVIGVGGGGSNAVNHMYNQGIKGVDFIVCNTDAQALDISPVPVKIQLGESLTEGRGAGSIPDVGKNAAIENIDDIKEILANNTKMVFVTAGMGGGTGTGAAPVIAQAAKDLGILTVGIVTVPFSFEGRKRKGQAELGIDAIRDAVDTLLIINNDRLREMFGNLTLQNAFAQADQVLSTAAKGIAEVISVTGQINVDFNDVNTVMRDSGVAIMGSAVAEGDNRSLRAVEEALSSPLLNDNEIMGARYVLLNITYGTREVLMDEITEITDYIQDEAGMDADVIWGHGQDEELGDKLSITIVATGFKMAPDTGVLQKLPERVKRNLDEEVKTNITAPIESPTQSVLPKMEAPTLAEEELVLKPKVEETKEEEQADVDADLKPAAQSEFTFDMTNKGSEKVEDNEEAEVKRYVLEDDTEESPLDTWVESSQRNMDVGAGADKVELEDKEESNWQPVLKTNADDNDQVDHVEEQQVVTDRLETESVDQSEEVKSQNDENLSDKESWNWKPTEESTESQKIADDSSEISREEQEQLAEDRISRIKRISLKLKTPSGIADLEDEPAYKRRNIKLDDIEGSDESAETRMSLGENDEGTSGLSTGNSFLHDNVD
ncbi:MAG: cell division protein FtsZ [Crocinitomicaceae bacterium]|nr:cell division protein FtsZ [Crocinitomicaceae bacterium]MBT5403313.1 cell division protein FtsZ [Crocinitomicaceae bacterium]MBT6514457.1 cell division protein FtsZ [Crocinitomicaceae bacterium]